MVFKALIFSVMLYNCTETHKHVDLKANFTFSPAVFTSTSSYVVCN